MKSRARKRKLQLKDMILPTPLVVPSFSSRVTPPVRLEKFLRRLLEPITGPLLLSAYDVHHHLDPVDDNINQRLFFAQDQEPFLVLLDSGGYEVIWNNRAQQAGIIQAADAPAWRLEDYLAILSDWPETIPLIAATFDAPERPSVDDQTAAATELAERFPKFSVDFLLKPPSGKPKERQHILELSDISPFIENLRGFPLIGVTEKEIGLSMRDRLTFLVKLRDLLDQANLEIPIHVFGGLDPLMTPLYFLAGADVFDGLSWLRYAFKDGISFYDQGFVATENPRRPIEKGIWEMRARNLRSLYDLEISMNKYLLDASIQDAFKPFGTNIQSIWDKIWTEE